MTLNERYRMHRGFRIKSYIKLLVVIAFVSTLAFTFSAYTGKIKIQDDFSVAKFEVAVNGEKITENGIDLENIKMIPNDGTSDGKIRAGETGYFDIEIDPTNTEVSVEYFITLDFSDLPEEINFNSYSIIQNSVETNKGSLPADNTITGEMLINHATSHEALDSTDIVKLRVYWKWLGEDWEVDDSTYNLGQELRANVVVQQKIAEN